MVLYENDENNMDSTDNKQGSAKKSEEGPEIMFIIKRTDLQYLTNMIDFTAFNVACLTD